MNRRSPMAPPTIAGYSYQRLLGSGGYSDVFLYEQEMPRRPVAIKVLVADRLDDHTRRLVSDEANAMAAVSTHPYIVTIFHADIGSSGNPFLVMEYYPQPNYSVRSRTEQLSVAEVLRAGIQVASAVETAHRAGIIHRDIKPANILTSEYGRPGLTDFGIAGLDGGSTDPAEGLSVPWSPPEIITGDASGGVLTDVYSLGATIYSLLVGRSPFEVPGGANSTLDLLERIQRSELPPTGRGDVPSSLERLLRHAMARRPEDRPANAADVARALQDIEVQQQFAMTPLEVRDEGGPGPRSRNAADEHEDGTRLKSPTVIHSQTPTAPAAGLVEEGLVRGVPSVASEGATVHRTSLPGAVAGAGSGLGATGYAPTSGVVVPPSLGVPAGSSPSVAHGAEPAVGSTVGAGTGTDVRPAATGSGAERRLTLVRVAWIGLAVVAVLVVIRLLTGGPEMPPPTTTTTSNFTGGVAGSSGSASSSGKGDTVPAPTGVTLSTDASGALVVSWAAPSGAAADEEYIVTPAGKGIEGQFPEQPAPGATSLVVPDGTDCVGVRVVRDGSESTVATNCPDGG